VKRSFGALNNTSASQRGTTRSAASTCVNRSRCQTGVQGTRIIILFAPKTQRETGFCVCHRFSQFIKIAFLIGFYYIYTAARSTSPVAGSRYDDKLYNLFTYIMYCVISGDPSAVIICTPIPLYKLTYNMQFYIFVKLCSCIHGALNRFYIKVCIGINRFNSRIAHHPYNGYKMHTFIYSGYIILYLYK